MLKSCYGKANLFRLCICILAPAANSNVIHSFVHDCFRKNRPDLLHGIKRRANKKVEEEQIQRSSRSSVGTARTSSNILPPPISFTTNSLGNNSTLSYTTPALDGANGEFEYREMAFSIERKRLQLENQRLLEENRALLEENARLKANFRFVEETMNRQELANDRQFVLTFTSSAASGGGGNAAAIADSFTFDPGRKDPNVNNGNQPEFPFPFPYRPL